MRFGGGARSAGRLRPPHEEAVRFISRLWRELSPNGIRLAIIERFVTEGFLGLYRQTIRHSLLSTEVAIKVFMLRFVRLLSARFRQSRACIPEPTRSCSMREKTEAIRRL